MTYLSSIAPYAAKYHDVAPVVPTDVLVKKLLRSLVCQLHAKYLLKIKPPPLYAFRYQVLQDIRMNEHIQTVGQTDKQIFRQTQSYLQSKYDRKTDSRT